MPRPAPSQAPKRRSTCTPADVFHDVVRYSENGEVRPVLAATWLAEAQATFLAKDHIGKIVINMSARPNGHRS